MDYSAHSVFLSNKDFHKDGVMGMLSVLHSFLACPIQGTSENVISIH
jgi:hypothetical protein